MPKPPDSFFPIPPDDGRFGPEAAPALRKTDRGGQALLPLVISLRTAERVVIDAPLLEAFQAAASRHTLLALRSDLTAFDLWCRQHRRITLPAGAHDVADYLKSRAGQGAKPASLARYKASIARLHQLLGLVDPTTAPLVKLILAAIRREKGVAQRQAAPLRFKGPVSDVERDPARGLPWACATVRCSVVHTTRVCAPANSSRLRWSTSCRQPIPTPGS